MQQLRRSVICGVVASFFTCGDLVPVVAADVKPVPCPIAELAAAGWYSQPAATGPSGKMGGNVNGANRAVNSFLDGVGIRGTWNEPWIGPLPMPRETDKPNLYFGARYLLPPTATGPAQSAVTIDGGYIFEPDHRGADGGITLAGWNVFMKVTQTRILAGEKCTCYLQTDAQTINGKPYRVPVGQLGSVHMSFEVTPNGVLYLTTGSATVPGASPLLPPNAVPSDGNIIVDPQLPPGISGQFQVRRSTAMTQVGGATHDGAMMIGAKFSDGYIATRKFDALGVPYSDWQPWATGTGLMSFEPSGNNRNGNEANKVGLRLPLSDPSNGIWNEVSSTFPWVIDFGDQVYHHRDPQTGIPLDNYEDTSRYANESVNIVLVPDPPGLKKRGPVKPTSGVKK